MPDTSNAPRRKVRCPKCTAVFSERAKYPFECPICSCRLSAKGGSPLPVALSSLENKTAVGPENAVNRSEQSEEVCLKDENATLQDVDLKVFEGNMGESLTHIDNKGQVPVAPDESHGVPETDSKEEKLVADISVKSLHESKENRAKDSPLTANLLDVANNEVLEGEDSPAKVCSTPKMGDLLLMRTSRCELSFKYSLERAHLDESDINRKRLPLSKFSSSMPNTERSDVSLHAPLRVRISSRHEESSDHSENGRYSFSSETESHDGSESDFDFPAPWANDAQPKVLPDEAGQCEPVSRLSEKKRSAAPHQLELWDANDATNNGQDFAEESTKVFKEIDIKPALQGGDGSNALSLLRKENELKGHEETSSFDLLSQINNLAKIMKYADTFNDNKQNPDENLAAAMPLNQQDTPSMPSLQLKHDLHKGPSSHDLHKGPSSHDLQALDDCASGEVAHFRQKNGIIPFVLQGARADVHSSDWDNGAMAISTYIERRARDDNGSDRDLLPNKNAELDLYIHHKIGEWQHEQTDDSPSSPHCHEIMQHRSHELEPHQMKAHQNGLPDNAATGILHPDCPPGNHYVLGHHRFGTSNSEQLYNYQAPAQSGMLPTLFQLDSMAPHAFQYVPNSCTLCSHNPYPGVQAHSGPHCVVCRSCSGSVTCNSGPCTQCSCHQPLHGLEPTFRSSQVACTQRPTNLNQSLTFPSVDARSQAYLSCNLSRFPPLPKDGAAPYVLCKGCGTVLHVPLKLPLTTGFVQKLRCSACGKVNKFSVNQYTKQGHGVPNSPSEERNSIAGIPVSSTQHLLQYNSGSLPYSHNQRVLVTSSWHLEESYCKNVSQDDAHVFMSRSRAGPLSSRGGNHLTVCMTDLPVDRSINVSSGIRTEGRVSGLSQNVEDRHQVMAVLPLHGIVDEKEEGLDFGAPRISDGESLDPSESRMRSPENLQIPCTFTGVPEADPVKMDLSHEVKQQGHQLLELLNQESTRFRLNLDLRPPDKEVKSASWSPASDSHRPNFLKRKERRSSQSHKGPKYIAGLLRRSLKDVSKGGKELAI